MEKSEKDQLLNHLLMVEAAKEIDRLEAKVHRLEEYQIHTERMLALFEGGPRLGGEYVAGDVHIAQSLRQRAKELAPVITKEA